MSVIARSTKYWNIIGAHNHTMTECDVILQWYYYLSRRQIVHRYSKGVLKHRFQVWDATLEISSPILAQFWIHYSIFVWRPLVMWLMQSYFSGWQLVSKETGFPRSVLVQLASCYALPFLYFTMIISKFILEKLHALTASFVQCFPFIYVTVLFCFVCFFINIDTKETMARLGPL